MSIVKKDCPLRLERFFQANFHNYLPPTCCLLAKLSQYLFSQEPVLNPWVAIHYSPRIQYVPARLLLCPHRQQSRRCPGLNSASGNDPAKEHYRLHTRLFGDEQMPCAGDDCDYTAAFEPGCGLNASHG